MAPVFSANPFNKAAESIGPPYSPAELAEMAGLAVVYFISAKLGLRWAFVHVSATAVWPPSGIALAGLLLLGCRVWPGILIGAFAANITTAGSAATCLAVASGNTLEALAGAWMTRRYANGPSAFYRTPDVVKFLFLAGLASTLISATIGTLSLSLQGLASWSQFEPIWLTWWLGDASGVVVVAPVILLWALDRRVRWAGIQALEAALLLASLILLSQIVFRDWQLGGANHPSSYLVWPILTWAAVRFGPRETATSLFFIACLGLYGTLHGTGPFSRESPNENLLVLQVFLGVCNAMALILAASVSEREEVREDLLKTQGELEVRVISRTAELLRVNADLLAEAREREKAETEARRASEQLARSNAELNLFASAVSHELHEPVRKIIAFGELIDPGKSKGPEVRDYVERMKKAALRLEQLIDGLLRMSRVTKQPRPIEPVDLGAIVQEAASDLRERIEKEGGAVHIGPLPTLQGDPLQLRQLFQNLISNAFKFRKKDAPLRLDIAAEEPLNGFVAIRVTDNGIGFEQQDAQRIFEPFQRLHPRGQYEGSGLGLAICERIALRHGGQIEARSEPGKGSEFRVTLPA